MASSRNKKSLNSSSKTTTPKLYAYKKQISKTTSQLTSIITKDSAKIEYYRTEPAEESQYTQNQTSLPKE